MRTIRVLLFLGIVGVVGGLWLVVTAFEPEVGRDMALRQFESADQPRQLQRLYEGIKPYVSLVGGLTVILSFLGLFGRDLVEWAKKPFDEDTTTSPNEDTV